MFKKKILRAIVLATVACIIYIALYFSFKAPCDMRARAQSLSNARGMITIEAKTRRILYEKNPHMRLAEASTTKIATAITVLENTEDIDKVYPIPRQAVGIEGSSIYLGYDEELSVRDLLYGLMLQSGNDCAVALAIITSGSVEKFAALMNETAVKAGAKDTNFVNPHGLHDDNHYTTAYDLAMITAYAMENETFKEIVATKVHKTPWKGHDYDRVIVNKNKILSTFEGGDGVKTGYTKRAGRCLVASATRNGMQIISVVLNDGPMFEDCRFLMSKAFEEFSPVKVISKNIKIGEVEIENCKTGSVAVGTKEDIILPLSAKEKNKLSIKTEFAEDLPPAPIKNKIKTGVVRIYAENRLIFETELYNIEEALPLSMYDTLKELVEKWNG